MRRALLVLALCAACEDSSSGGAGLALSWAFGPQGLDCAGAGVQSVHVFIGPLAPTGSYDQELQCEAGETGVRLRGVAPGPHLVVLKGIAKDKVLYELEQEMEIEGDLGHMVLQPYSPP